MIRKASLEDKPRIKKLWYANDGFLGGLIEGALNERIANNAVLVFEKGGLILGFLEYRQRVRDKMNVVYHLAVDSEHRGKGIAQALMNALPLPIRLKVTSDNPDGIRFYERYGMQRIGEETLSSGRTVFIYERLK